jgi:hypothetical protein
MKILRQLALLLILLGRVGTVFAQGAAVNDSAILNSGGSLHAIPGATITVCTLGATGLPCNAPLTIYSNITLTTAIGTSMTADSNGNFSYFIAPGNYTETVTASGVTGRSITRTVPGGTVILVAPGSPYPCSDVGINAAVTALGTNGGTVDATLCYAAGTIASTVIVGANTGTNSHGVKLILPCTYSPWAVTVTGGSHVFRIGDSSELAGCANRASIIQVQASANIADVVSFIGNPATGGYTEYGKASSLWIENDNAGATITNGLFNLTGAYDSIINDLKLVGYAPCLFYVSDSTNPIGANADDVSNLLLEGLYDTGTQLMCIHPTHGAFIGPIHFHGGDWSHPGPGKNSVKIDQANTTHSYGLSFTDIYMEGSNTDTTTAIWNVSDTLSPSFNNIYIFRNAAASTAPCLYFNDTGSGATDNISVKNLSCNGGMTANAIQSNIAGIPNMAVNLVPALFSPGIAGLGLTSNSAIEGLDHTTFASAGGTGTNKIVATSGNNSNYNTVLPSLGGTISLLGLTACGSSTACSAVQQPGKGWIINGTFPFSASTTASVTAMAPAFTSATSYSCTFDDPTHPAYTWSISAKSTTGFTVTAGTSNSDTWTYTCVGY